MTAAEPKPLEQLIEEGEREFYRLFAERRVKKPAQADECAQDAAAIVADANGLSEGSDEYNALCEALDRLAADEFASVF